MSLASRTVARTRRTPAPAADAPVLNVPALVGDDQRGRVTPWAVLPSTLAAIASLLRRDPHAGAPIDPSAIEALRTVTAQLETTETAVSPGVAVIPLRGLITPRPSFMSWLFGGGGGLCGFRESFREAIGDDDITAVLIDVDSPGGSTDLVSEVAGEIRAARGTKPIVAIANTMAASAAYWLASQADELVVTPSGFVGSVGVYAVHDDWSGFNEQLGVIPEYVSAGKYKTEGNPDEPLTESARTSWQETVDDMYGLFVADVAVARSVSDATVRSGYGEGRVLTAQRALDAGMVDSVESYDDVVDRLLGNPPEPTTATGAAALSRQRAEASRIAEQLSATEHPELAAALRTHLNLEADASSEDVLAALRAVDTATAVEGLAPDDTSPPADRDETASPASTPGWLLLPKPRH